VISKTKTKTKTLAGKHKITIMKRSFETQGVATSTKRIRIVAPKYQKVYDIDKVDRIAKSIRKRGFAVVNVGNIRVGEIRNMIDEEIESFPEFIEGASREPLGGFAAFGNPASFHNPTVRALRLDAYEQISPVLDALKPDDSYNKEAVIDRMMVRPAGASPSAESWHRDEAPNAANSDIVLGGWWNFDDAPSYLSCVKGSHKGVHGHKGFALVSKEEAAKYSTQKILVEVPSGHILLFNEQLVHEVMAKKLKYKSYRLFLGWRITKEKDPLDKDLVPKLKAQAAMQIKSAQEPPMYAKLHWTNWVDKLNTFSENFKPQCRSVMTVKSGKRKGESFNIVHRHMSSLEEYGFKKYPEYTESEIEILIPHHIIF
jgi:hypothetical protein